MKVKFCGAAQEVTGSSHLLTLDSGLTILLDCGLYQGGAEDMEGFNREWLFDPSTIDILIVSHAHIDHTGRIPKLIRDGFNGRIYSTHATRSLCSLMLMDSARIQEYDAKYARRKKLKDRSEPLYTTKDAKKALDLFEGLSFEHWHQIDDHVRIFLRDTGHILGSASVTLEIKENDEIKRFGFTGDIGRPNRPILKDPAPMPEVDYLISESTYGNKEHTSAPAELDEFLDIITKVCIENKGKLIIPAFSVGRTQEIVYMLDQLSTERSLPRISVYVDSPLAVNATEVFRIHPECFDDQLIEYMQEDPNPFGFDHLFYIRHAKDSKLINDINEPAIIISSSGMANAGRIRHHIFNNIKDEKNAVLIVGYCSPKTTGGRLRDGKKYIYIFGKNLEVKANVYIMDGFSAHADRLEIYDFIKNQQSNLKKLFLVHGTLDRQESFKGFLKERGFENTEIPALGQEFEL